MASQPRGPYHAAPVAEIRRPSQPDPPLLRSLLVPLSIMTAFLLFYGARLPFGVVVASTVPFIALFVLAPRIGRASMTRFDRDRIMLLATDRQSELEARLRAAIGMRLFAPPALVHERRGMVASETGRHTEAQLAYRRAIEAWDGDAPSGVLLGYADACYALGDDAEAAEMYRRLLGATASLPRVKRNLAHALARSGEELDEAIALARDAYGEATSPEARTELKLILALAYAHRADRDKARAAMREAGVVEGETAEALRDEVREVLKAGN